MGLAEYKEKYRNYGEPWTKELDDILKSMFVKGTSIPKLMEYFGRSEGSIYSRLVSLKLIDYCTGKRISTGIHQAEDRLKRKIGQLRADITVVRARIKQDLELLNHKRDELFKTQEQLDEKGLNKEKLEKLLEIAVQDMVENNWYINMEEAVDKLFTRV